MAFRVPDECRRALEVFGLSGVAVAQPLFEVFGASPEVFVFADATNADIVAFALVLLLVPPLLLWGVGALVGLVRPTAREPVHLASLGLLTALLTVYLVKHQGLGPGLWLVPVGLLAAGALVVGYRRVPAVATLLRYLAFGPVVFLVGFLAFSPTGELMKPSGAEAATLDIADPEALPPVVMIVFDEWPLTSIVDQDGRIDAELYPNLARLAGDATWYRNTTTVSNSTLFAVPSILTGRMPEQDRSADARSHPENLFTLLGGSYQLEAVEPVTRLCPAAMCNEPQAPPAAGGSSSTHDRSLRSLLDDAREVYRSLVEPVEADSDTATLEEAESAVVDQAVVDQRVSEARRDRGAVDIDAVFQARPAGLNGLLSTIRADEPPTVHFLHLLLPHTPYSHLATGERYEADERLREADVLGNGPGGNLRGPAAWAAEFDRHRMLQQTGYLDSLVGTLLAKLDRTGLYDDAMVVVTADHGIAFEPGAPIRGLGAAPMPDSTMPDMGWVPLIVKAPGQTEGAVDDRNALTIDVLPTMADLLGIEMPWRVDGRSLAGRPRATDRKPFLRAVGTAFAAYEFQPAVRIDRQASLADVFARGVDTFLPPLVGVDRWYAHGPRPDLLGRSVADFPAGPGSTASATLETGASITVDPGGRLPAIATARVGGAPVDGTAVAIAVDGTIAAVVPTYTDPSGPGKLAAFLLRSTLTEGDHTVSLFLVGAGSLPTLRPIPLG